MKGVSKYPRIIPCAIYAPNRIISQVAITAENVPGALAKVASKMAEHKVNILSGLIMAEPDMASGTLTMFLDLTDADVDLSKLLKELRALNVVLKAEVVTKKIGDMAVDGTTHATTFLGGRVVVLDVNDISAMLGWLIRTFYSGGRAIIFDMGKRVGASAAKKFKSSYELRGRELVETFLALQAAAGWFDYEVVSFDEGGPELDIRLYENFECLPLKGKSDKPVSNFVRGALAGVVGEAFERDFSVNEVRCLAVGDPYCEFVVKPKPE